MPARRRTRLRLLFLFGLLLLAIWVLFFDSHSVLRRLQWHHELTALRQENQALEQRIAELEEQLKHPLSDAEVERIAREKYGMHRPEETVYPVKKERP